MEMPTQPKEDLRTPAPAPDPVPAAVLPPRKEAGIFAMLAAVLGLFGAHWFYLGRIKDGLGYFRTFIILSAICAVFGALVGFVGALIYSLYVLIAVCSCLNDISSARKGNVKDACGRPLL